MQFIDFIIIYDFAEWYTAYRLPRYSYLLRPRPPSVPRSRLPLGKIRSFVGIAPADSLQLVYHEDIMNDAIETFDSIWHYKT